MQKEPITQRQASCILIMFILGTTLVFGIGTQAGQDMWISLIITLAMIIPVALVYARIIQLFPGKDLFAIMEDLFGEIFGKILTTVWVWYGIHLGASVLRNFTDFIQVTSMTETPQLPIAIIILAVVLYLAKCGTEILGKWAVVTFGVICVIIPFTLLLSLRDMDWTNIMPVMNNEWGVILKTASQQFSLPFGETVLFLGIAGSLKKEDSPYKAYLYGILVVGFLSALILLRNIMVLGPAMMEAVYYPSFVAAKIINPGEFFARIESTIAMNYLFAGVTKIALCVLAAAKGLAGLFDMENYKMLLVPVCLLCLMFSLISYSSVTDLFDFVSNYYPIYVIPFQIIIPLLVWITAEIKKSRYSMPQ